MFNDWCTCYIISVVTGNNKVGYYHTKTSDHTANTFSGIFSLNFQSKGYFFTSIGYEPSFKLVFKNLTAILQETSSRFLTRTEFVRIFEKHFPHSDPYVFADHVFRTFDINHDGNHVCISLIRIIKLVVKHLSACFDYS